MSRSRQQRGHRGGVTLIEVVVLIAVTVVLVGAGGPLLGVTGRTAMEARSLANLRRLGVANAMYAADFDDRQFQLVPDDYGVAGGSCFDYEAGIGPIPDVVLGRTCGDPSLLFIYGPQCVTKGVVIPPIDFQMGFGAFRFATVRAFHDYVGGRVFDPTFYAPKDEVLVALIEPLFAIQCEYVQPPSFQLNHASSYIFSPAAMFHPDVLRPQSEGGFQDPGSFDQGYASPTVSQALHPSQKTQMLEHHWLQNNVAGPCNPAFTGGSLDGCEPYYFNHGAMSVPFTLFFDGHVRGLPVAEAVASNERVLDQTGEGLWSLDTPLGPGGYFGDFSFDATDAHFHVLTTGGIRGRDTIR